MQPFCTCYNDTGLFGVYTTTRMGDKDEVHDVFHEIQQEMVALTTGTAEEDLAMAKNQLKYNTTPSPTHNTTPSPTHEPTRYSPSHTWPGG